MLLTLIFGVVCYLLGRGRVRVKEVPKYVVPDVYKQCEHHLISMNTDPSAEQDAYRLQLFMAAHKLDRVLAVGRRANETIVYRMSADNLADMKMVSRAVTILQREVKYFSDPETAVRH